MILVLGHFYSFLLNAQVTTPCILSVCLADFLFAIVLLPIQASRWGTKDLSVGKYALSQVKDLSVGKYALSQVKDLSVGKYALSEVNDLSVGKHALSQVKDLSQVTSSTIPGSCQGIGRLGLVLRTE